MSFKVVIPTSGIGSRLFKLTKNLNKSLIAINNKPVICHIIEKFPKNCHFVIPVGFKGHLVKDFLKISYPKKKFTFVKIKNFSGKNSGLGLSLLKCKKYLQEPFVFIACDTIVKEKILPPIKNWVAYSNHILKSKNFRRCLVKNNSLLNLVEKNSKFLKNQYPYIGLCGIKDYKDFWKALGGDKKFRFLAGESYAIQEMLKSLKFFCKKYTWFDMGNLETYQKTKKFFERNNEYNILDKEDEAIWFVDNKVVKYSSDKTFVKKRYLRTEYLKGYVPKIIDIKKHMYSYALEKGKIFSSNPSLKNFKELLNFSEKFWELDRIKNSNKEQKKKAEKFYRDKTISRVKLFFKIFSIKDSINLINSEKVNSVKNLLKAIDWNDLCSGKFGRFHGDYHFENILINQNNKNHFILLDWRQDFQGSLSKGDIYYDLAKLLHGMIVSHPQVVLNKFKFYKRNKNIKVSIEITKDIKNCRIYFYKWLEKNNLSKNKVNIITSLIFLNIAPLHHYPYNNFLFYLGKLMLQKTLNNEDFFY